MTTPAVRRSLAMLVATGLAIAGLVTLVVLWLSMSRQTILATDSPTTPCMVEYAKEDSQAHVRYEILPPRSVCTWDVAGAEQEETVVQPSEALAVAAAVALVVGVGGTVALLVSDRRRSRAARLAPRTGTGPTDPR
ncbi:hypothetical protein IC607_12915 [Cellulomonas sp. JH27-2]|uniref:hypothetical protein n=1 Tax=Cellulomonas sp. JH27-2 TaxID=2774139 RepID=UPI00177F6A27|nr:hypothetical protein [Cellulomonas sp. JH27-2]MBD8059868.1 hypothetical protein [Cellulomonas sp. JH27-2]